MNIKELAEQAGANFEHIQWVERDLAPLFERFAALVAAAERKEWEAEFAGMGEWACVHLLEERSKA